MNCQVIRVVTNSEQVRPDQRRVITDLKDVIVRSLFVKSSGQELLLSYLIRSGRSEKAVLAAQVYEEIPHCCNVKKLCGVGH